MISPHDLAAAARACVAQLGESGLLAGAVAGGLLSAVTAASGGDGVGGDSSVAAGLVAGVAAGYGCRAALRHSFRRGLPATAATLYTVGGSGAAGGLLGAALAPALGAATARLRDLLLAPTRLPMPAAALAGAAMGVATVHRGPLGWSPAGAVPLPYYFPLGPTQLGERAPIRGRAPRSPPRARRLRIAAQKQLSIHGYYHCVLFPLILVEMEHGAPSLLGALDAACAPQVAHGAAPLTPTGKDRLRCRPTAASRRRPSKTEPRDLLAPLARPQLPLRGLRRRLRRRRAPPARARRAARVRARGAHQRAARRLRGGARGCRCPPLPHT